jgi:UDP-N-acetylglucosamine transferase subunit ALG13
MIFVTIGTTPFPFRRMVDIVKGLVELRRKRETIIFQHGNTPCEIKAKNVILYRYLPFQKMEQYIKQARIIVTHGGPATIYQVLAVGKIPYVLPRKKIHGEHVNDHQVIFVEMLQQKKLIKSLSPFIEMSFLNENTIALRPKIVSTTPLKICQFLFEITDSTTRGLN